MLQKIFKLIKQNIGCTLYNNSELCIDSHFLNFIMIFLDFFKETEIISAGHHGNCRVIESEIELENT